METARIYISMLIIMFMITFAVFLFEIQQSNDFKQYVNYQIERNGGLTAEAMENINQYSEDNYNGNFEVNSDQMNEKLPFGSTVEYEIVGTFNFLFLNFDTQSFPIKGSGVSLIR